MSVPVVGVYLLTSNAGDVYVGSSTDCLKRWSWHKALLKQGRHPYPKLQQAWPDVQFKVVEECTDDKKFDCEQRWMDKYPDRINIKERADGKGYSPDESVKEKMSLAAKERNARPEYKKLIAERCKAQHESGSLSRTPEFIAKAKTAMLGKAMPEEAKARLREIALADREKRQAAARKSVEVRRAKKLAREQEAAA